MKQIIQQIISEYLKIFPTEKLRLKILQDYLLKNSDNKITDWNNISGHLTAGGFLYCLENQKFLVMYHKDLKMYLYPGGHMENGDKNPLERAKLEVIEETGVEEFSAVKINDNPLIPIDIDTHIIPYNARVSMPEHYHFDFRYLFICCEKEPKVYIDKEEMNDYIWIDKQQLKADKNYGNIIDKLELLLKD